MICLQPQIKDLMLTTFFLDFAKAFNSVCHILLIYKLNQLNTEPNVLSCIKQFISNQTQYVAANNQSSTYSPVASKVPQGFNLGHLLFLIYINDFPNCANSSLIILLADDCVIYCKITIPGDSQKWLGDLHNLSLWCNKWLMKLNANKCRSMHMSHTVNNGNQYRYIQYDTLILSVRTHKYLGLFT